MLCSDCKKKQAVIYINKVEKSQDGLNSTKEVVGLCMECAKKRGIDPFSNITDAINNMSQEELASKTCVSRSSIALYEKGIRNPSKETIRLICKALNISVDDLIEQRSIKRSVINFFLCITGVFLSILPFMVILYDLFYKILLEPYIFDKVIFDYHISKSIYQLVYFLSLILGIIMYYLLFTNLRNSKKKSLLFAFVALPLFILFVIYTLSYSIDLFKNFPDYIINYICIPLLVFYYIIAIYFITKNLILEKEYIKERISDKNINRFYIITNILFVCLIIGSVIFIYTANVTYYSIETLYYEYSGQYSVIKHGHKVSLFSIFHTKKIFSLVFMILQILIFSFSLINIVIKNNKTREILTLTNICMSLLFIVLWIIYPTIFGEIIEGIKIIPIE